MAHYCGEQAQQTAAATVGAAQHASAQAMGRHHCKPVPSSHPWPPSAARWCMCQCCVHQHRAGALVALSCFTAFRFRWPVGLQQPVKLLTRCCAHVRLLADVSRLPLQLSMLLAPLKRASRLFAGLLRLPVQGAWLRAQPPTGAAFTACTALASGDLHGRGCLAPTAARRQLVDLPLSSHTAGRKQVSANAAH